MEAEPVLEVGAENSDKAGRYQQASTLKRRLETLTLKLSGCVNILQMRQLGQSQTTVCVTSGKKEKNFNLGVIQTALCLPKIPV